MRSGGGGASTKRPSACALDATRRGAMAAIGRRRRLAARCVLSHLIVLEQQVCRPPTDVAYAESASAVSTVAAVVVLTSSRRPLSTSSAYKPAAGIAASACPMPLASDVAALLPPLLLDCVASSPVSCTTSDVHGSPVAAVAALAAAAPLVGWRWRR